MPRQELGPSTDEGPTRPAPPPASQWGLERTSSIDGVLSNSAITAVPPANSIAFGIPLVAIITAPAMMRIHETATACQRQRRKL